MPIVLLTPEERKIHGTSPGITAKERCGECNKPIFSTLTYISDDGKTVCSRACLGAANEKAKRGTNSTKDKKMAKIKKSDEDDVKKKKKKKSKDEEEDTPKKKKKKSSDDEDDDEDEKPKKKKKDDDDDEDKPKKKKKKATSDHPFREGTIIHTAFEACREKGGITHKELVKLLKKNGTENYTRVLTTLRAGAQKGGFNGHSWEFKEKDTDDGGKRYRVIF